tara:strand:- start:822 stop:1118 length:297 start_codon:yes stop_codon:yes gene_type:complete
MSSVVAKAILRLEPNAQFAVFGTKDNYTIRWDSEDITQPSQSDLDASIVEVEKLAYQDKRRKEYPNIGDQLDDLYAKGAFSDDMAAKIKAVKDKYPKG